MLAALREGIRATSSKPITGDTTMERRKYPKPLRPRDAATMPATTEKLNHTSRISMSSPYRMNKPQARPISMTSVALLLTLQMRRYEGFVSTWGAAKLARLVCSQCRTVARKAQRASARPRRRGPILQGWQQRPLCARAAPQRAFGPAAPVSALERDN